MLSYRRFFLTFVAVHVAIVSGSTNATDELTNSLSPVKCPVAHASDVWLNRRLSCLSVGQMFIDISAGATGARRDTAFIVRERPMDGRFHNILGSDIGRHFKHFLCVRNTPANIDRQSLATDLLIAMGMTTHGSLKPPGISAVAMEIAGTKQSGFANIPCDSERHPLIVNYDTGRIESLNVKALSVLETYDE